MQCWAFPDPEREVFDQVCSSATGRPTPFPDAHAEGMVMEWSVGGAGAFALPARPVLLPGVQPGHVAQGDILFTTRTVDPVAAATEARRSGLWTNTDITDTLCPPGTPAPAR